MTDLITQSKKLVINFNTFSTKLLTLQDSENSVRKVT